MTTQYQQALWSSYVLGECLKEAGEDTLSGLEAARYILTTQPIPQGFVALSISDTYRDSYPRNNANQFLNKHQIAKAARDNNTLVALRESIPEIEQFKLDAIIQRLHAGDRIHHPSEHPGLGVNLEGVISDPSTLLQQVMDEIASLREEIKSSSKSTESSTDLIHGGKADNKPDSDFDPKSLAQGIIVEIEHTNDFAVAKEIAKDHLTEDKEYYKKLAEVGLSVDAQGLHHRGKGKGGGQFISKGKGGSKGESKKGTASASGSQARKKAKRAESSKEPVQSLPTATSTEKPKGKVASIIGKVLGGAIAAGKKAGAAEHYATNWIAEKVETLPTPLRLSLKGLYYAGFSIFLTGQAAARAVAHEVGGEEEAKRIGARCAGLDNCAAVAAKIAGFSGVHGPAALPLIIPVASTSYLCYSGVRHPVATFNAARVGIGIALSKLKKVKQAAVEKLRGSSDGQSTEQSVDTGTSPVVS